jgi:hypothetical protein
MKTTRVSDDLRSAPVALHSGNILAAQAPVGVI